MAIIVQVKPEFDGKIAIQSSGSLNGTILSNSLSQETLYAIFRDEEELRPYLTTTYATVGGSYPEGTIDPSLLHAYDSSEVTHNPAGMYGAGTLGKALVETKAKIDSFDGAFVSPLTQASIQMNWAGGKLWNNRIPFSRNSIGSFIDANGFIKIAAAGKPRFTHDPVTKESLGLLMEEARTNLVTYSGDLSNAAYTKNRCSIATGVLGVDGVIGQKIVEDTATNTHQLARYDIPVVANTTYTASVFLKAAERSTVMVQLTQAAIYNGNIPSVTVDLGLGTISNPFATVGTKIENWGNGWYRVSITATTTTAGNTGISIVLGTGVYLGDGTSGVYMFGLQLEAGLYASSYIPTTAAAVSRSTDLIDITSTTFTDLFGINITEGTLYINAKKAQARGTGSYKYYARLRGANNNSVFITDSDVQKVYSEVYKDAVVVFSSFNIASAISDSAFFQHAIAFQVNNTKAYENGNATALDVDCTMPTGLNQFTIGGDISTIIKSIAFYPRRMTDNGMYAMTNPSNLVGLSPSQIVSAGRLGSAAFVGIGSLFGSPLNRQEFPLYGTGASLSVNIRRNYPYFFEIVDSSGVTSITAQPSSDCTADTDNTLTFTAPVGKTLVYAIVPKI